MASNAGDTPTPSRIGALSARADLRAEIAFYQTSAIKAVKAFVLSDILRHLGSRLLAR